MTKNPPPYFSYSHRIKKLGTKSKPKYVLILSSNFDSRWDPDGKDLEPVEFLIRPQSPAKIIKLAKEYGFKTKAGTPKDEIAEKAFSYLDDVSGRKYNNSKKYIKLRRMLSGKQTPKYKGVKKLVN